MREILLAKKYGLLRRIGRGGMAEVFIARQRGVGGFEKLVVIKRPLPRLARDPHFRRMFLEEARLAADLRHPNIVSILEVAADQGGVPFIAMEYLHGRDLGQISRRVARQGRRLPLEHALQMVMDAAAGLHYAHKKRTLEGEPLGLVHRDVSPQNIVGTFSGRTALVDFGIAKVRGGNVDTESGYLKGKCAYMSPEQVRGEHLDGRSDLFALGIVMFELLTYRPLFRRKSDLQSLQAVLSCEIPKPSEICEDLDDALDDIVKRALEAEPDARFPDGEAFATAIEGYIESRGLRVSQRRTGAFLRRAFSQEIEAERVQLQVQLTTEGAPISVEDDASNLEDDAYKTSTLITPSPSAHNLPPLDVPLIGRDALLHALRVGLSKGQIATLVGAAGVGTTHLALSYAHEQLSRLAPLGGAWFLRCTELSTVDGLLAGLDHLFGHVPGEVLSVDLRARRAGRRMSHRGPMLLILDDVDRVPASDVLVQRFVEAAPELKVLSTARAAFGISGERAINVPPLAVPALDLMPEKAVQSASVRLMIHHLVEAGAKLPSPQILAEIARRCDGIPLALEIAAEQVARRGPTHFLEELRARGARAMNGLPAALDSSWDVLTSVERDALAQLAVIPGTFDLALGQAVLDVGVDAVEIIDELTRKSLLRRTETHDGQVRLSMIATVRALTATHDTSSGQAASRLAAHLVPAASALAKNLDGPGGPEMAARLELECTNLLAVCERSLAREDGDDALSTAVALEVPLGSDVDRLRSLLDRALALPQSDDGLRALGLEVRADLHRAAGRFDDAQADLEEALRLARGTSSRLEGIIQRNFAVLFRKQGDLDKANLAAQTAIAIFRELGDRHMEARARLEVGRVDLAEGNAARARDQFKDALKTFRLVGDHRFEARALARQGQAEAILDDAPTARVLVESAVAILKEHKDRHALGRVLELLGDLHLTLSAPKEAELAWREGMKALGEAGAEHQRAALAERAGRALAYENPTAARAFLDEAAAAWRELGEDERAGPLERAEV